MRGGAGCGHSHRKDISNVLVLHLRVLVQDTYFTLVSCTRRGVECFEKLLQHAQHSTE